MMVKNKKLFLLIPFILILALLIFVFSPPTDTERIYAHITIHGVPVGGMNREEAEAILMERFQTQLETRTIRYTKNNQPEAEFTFADFGARLDFTELVNAALEYSPGLPVRISRWLSRPHAIDAPVAYTFNASLMEDVLSELSTKLDIIPVNAHFSKMNGQISIHPEIMGQGIDTEHAALATQKILEGFASGTVELILLNVQPKYTAPDFDFEKSILGHFHTYVADVYGARGRNVQLASSRINNKMLFPGDVFSAGANIQANIPDSGYESAIVLVRGEPVEDIGGGVCQVVTTLYNSILYAELEIVQRHNHSARVSYADLGFDATIAGDYFDLKFKNNTNHPILITSWVADENLHVEIIGYEHRAPTRNIRFAASKMEITLPEPYREMVDATIPRGQRLITLESQMGYQVELHKVIYIDNQEVERVKINTSTYRPLQGIVAIGAG